MLAATSETTYPNGGDGTAPPVTGTGDTTAAAYAFVRKNDPAGVFWPTDNSLTDFQEYNGGNNAQASYTDPTTGTNVSGIPPQKNGLGPGFSENGDDSIAYTNSTTQSQLVWVTASDSSQNYTIWQQELSPGASVSISKPESGTTDAYVFDPASTSGNGSTVNLVAVQLLGATGSGGVQESYLPSYHWALPYTGYGTENGTGDWSSVTYMPSSAMERSIAQGVQNLVSGVNSIIGDVIGSHDGGSGVGSPPTQTPSPAAQAIFEDIKNVVDYTLGEIDRFVEKAVPTLESWHVKQSAIDDVVHIGKVVAKLATAVDDAVAIGDLLTGHHLLTSSLTLIGLTAATVAWAVPGVTPPTLAIKAAAYGLSLGLPATVALLETWDPDL